jgi:hypothetical protein
LGLVDFVDNWPWRSIFHGKYNFFEISWTLSITHGQPFQKIFLVNFNGPCPWTICTQPVIPNNNKVQYIIDSNRLEVKKTPKKRGRKPKNVKNNVQTIFNPAFCILSNIVFKIIIDQCPWTLLSMDNLKISWTKFP